MSWWFVILFLFVDGIDGHRFINYPASRGDAGTMNHNITDQQPCCEQKAETMPSSCETVKSTSGQ